LRKDFASLQSISRFLYWLSLNEIRDRIAKNYNESNGKYFTQRMVKDF
jgi:hypothetical protein